MRYALGILLAGLLASPSRAAADQDQRFSGRVVEVRQHTVVVREEGKAGMLRTFAYDRSAGRLRVGDRVTFHHDRERDLERPWTWTAVDADEGEEPHTPTPSPGQGSLNSSRTTDGTAGAGTADFVGRY